mmetsp:Transcript_90344/g.156476  ORF Transcript_90344/g.156476 Transcript_90344/m.156476 type:complete len:205 (-) Transcript_90344:77-691(-)
MADLPSTSGFPNHARPQKPSKELSNGRRHRGQWVGEGTIELKSLQATSGVRSCSPASLSSRPFLAPASPSRTLQPPESHQLTSSQEYSEDEMMSVARGMESLYSEESLSFNPSNGPLKRNSGAGPGGRGTQTQGQGMIAGTRPRGRGGNINRPIGPSSKQRLGLPAPHLPLGSPANRLLPSLEQQGGAVGVGSPIRVPKYSSHS